MKRWWPVLLLVLASVQPAMAQKYEGDITLSLQPGLGVAVGSFSNDYDIGVEYAGQVDFAVSDGTAVGLRTSYRLFNTTEESKKAFAKVAQFGVQAKKFFSPDSRAGMYGIAGGGVYWMKPAGVGRSEPDFGGFAGLGMHFQSSDRLAFFLESIYNNFMTEPTSTGFFSFSLGFTIGLSEE